jgi:1,2-diacylglycerol 3-alpha-glucosyltransferase
MRIAFFTNNYLPNVYGVPMSLETFRREFEKQGHTVFVFAPNFPGYQDENPHSFRYPSWDINIKFRLPLSLPYSFKMDKILAKMDLDIIHAHHPFLLGSAAQKWAKKKNIPLVFTWHTLYDRYTNFVPFLPAKWTASWIIKKAVQYANQTTAVIVPTESVAPIIREWGVKKRITAIATGIVPEEFADPQRNKIREKYGIKDDEILLLLVSRLTAEKNIEFLFTAVLEVLQKNKKVKFMLAGDGYLLPALKAKAKAEKLEERSIFIGIVERTELKNYYAAGDIFVYASKSETQGMIITEAMYSGLPIVAVKAPGIESLVENNLSGILTSENRAEFVRAVERLLGDENGRKKMGAVGARLAREKYTAKICADKLLAVYQELIRES